MSNKDKQYLTHKLDITYGKYLQSIALSNYIKNKIINVERKLYNDLNYHSKLNEESVKEYEECKTNLNDLILAKDLELQLQNLETDMKQLHSVMSNKDIILNKQLNACSNKMSTNNYAFVNNKENIERFKSYVEDISAMLNEIKFHDDFPICSDNIKQIESKIAKLIEKNTCFINHQEILENQVLQNASLIVHNENV